MRMPVVNKLLEIRNPRLWEEGHACSSDGKRFPSWSQNLMSERRSRYHGDGVLYWRRWKGQSVTMRLKTDEAVVTLYEIRRLASDCGSPNQGQFVCRVSQISATKPLLFLQVS